MDEFCVRLLSYFERGADGKPGRWPHATPSPEDMAGAGFRLQGSQGKSGDVVACDSCKLQAWKWEGKDNPFDHHQESSRNCEYVASAVFREHHEIFLGKQQSGKETDQSPATPPATPTKRSYRPRRRLTFSRIVTVHESEPFGQVVRGSPEQQEQSLERTEVSVTTGGVKFVIQFTDLGERVGKRARLA